MHLAIVSWPCYIWYGTDWAGVIGNLGLKEHFGRAGQARASLLALPLVLVGLAAAFAAIAESGVPAGLSRLSTDYPIRIDLAEVEQITARNSLTVHGELTAGPQPALAQAEDPLAPASDPLAQAGDPLAQNPALPSLVAGAEDGSSTSFPSPPADLGVGSSPSARIGSAGPIPVGVIALDYDLAGGPRSASTLQVRKDVQHDGQLVGRVEIRIDNNSAIYVARTDLLRVIPSAQDQARALQDEFVGLIELREAGINLRYDAANDRLVLRD